MNTASLSDLYQTSPNRHLLADALRVPVEKAVSEYTGRAWRVRNFADMHDFASHPAAILSDGDQAVFVKHSAAVHGLDQFEAELAGLRYLSAAAGVLTPAAIGIVAVENGYILVLEAVQPVERTPEHWREIGRTLARIHRIKGEQCGLDRQGYFGPLYQDNRPTPDCLSFYIERRLWPRLAGAIDSGSLPTALIREVERFINRLPALGIPAAQPTLLHGDAQANNFISTAAGAVAGAVAVDPAIYYGHPEMDLAYVDTFQPVPEELFLGYQEILPIDPGFNDRRDLWRVAAYLAMVQAGGPGYLGQLVEALKKYR
jgi:protein-ribulosamine 3-kinase